MTHVTHGPWIINPKQHVDRPYVKYLNVTIRLYVTIRYLVIEIFINIIKKLFDQNKKIDSSYTTDRLVIQHESRVFLLKV